MEAREKIFQAADRLFSINGFDATTTREIAEASNTNKALIHYHFKSKRGLFQAILDRYFDNLSETLQRVLFKNGATGDRLAAVIEAYVDFLAKNRSYALIVQREIAGGTGRERIMEHMIHNFQMIITALRDAYPESDYRNIDAEQLLISFYGMIVTYFTYSGVIERMLKSDPLSQANLAKRKEHLLMMAQAVLKAAG
ncbi:MAG TPA: TetR/AcrR family transcriptional regulator [Deltaproteobacteria bacterium]|nr:TetR/AcrR family transcriptional regulator [Deltaproteobacteria bacterium]